MKNVAKARKFYLFTLHDTERENSLSQKDKKNDPNIVGTRIYEGHYVFHFVLSDSIFLSSSKYHTIIMMSRLRIPFEFIFCVIVFNHVPYWWKRTIVFVTVILALLLNYNSLNHHYQYWFSFNTTYFLINFFCSFSLLCNEFFIKVGIS